MTRYIVTSTIYETRCETPPDVINKTITHRTPNRSISKSVGAAGEAGGEGEGVGEEGGGVPETAQGQGEGTAG